MRLRRASSRKAQIGLTLGLAIFFATFATTVAVYSRDHPVNVIVYIVGAGFGLVSLLLFYSGLHQLFAMRTPETIVEAESDEWKRGREVHLSLRQSGNAEFESLRVNLVGDEVWWKAVRGHRRRAKQVNHLATVNLFDSGAFKAPFAQSISVRVPDDLPRPADRTHREDWRLEVWGKVRGRADFQHVFPLHLQ